MVYTEKEAEEFLEKNGFFVVNRAYAYDKLQVQSLLKKLKFPVVMKVSGKSIVHKNVLGGIVLGIKNERMAFDAFDKLQQIKGFEGVMIQEQFSGKEVLIGVKKTHDFGHAVCVGTGGVNTEKLKDVSFRIVPFEEKEAGRMISETKISAKLGKEEKQAVEDVLMSICGLIERFPKISELDINPLIVRGNSAVVVDARIVVE